MDLAATSIDADRARETFLRGLFLSYGRKHSQDPAACETFVAAWPVIPTQDRHFGIANGMAWGHSARLEHGIEDGFAQAEGLSAPIRFIYLEELGWQLSRLQDLAGGRSGPHLAEAQPAERRCVVVHGIVRGAFSRDLDMAAAHQWLEEQPTCRVHILHALVQAGKNRGQSAVDLQALLDRELRPEDAEVWQSLAALP